MGHKIEEKWSNELLYESYLSSCDWVTQSYWDCKESKE